MKGNNMWILILTIGIVVIGPILMLLGVPELYAIVIVAVGLLFESLFVYDRKDKEKTAAKEKEAEEKARRVANYRFYNECKKAGIRSLDTPEKQEKAKLIASSLGIEEGTDLFALFKEKQEQDIQAEEREQQKKRQEILQKEQDQYDALTKYSDLTGREKRLQILTDLRDEKKREISESYNSKNSMISLTGAFMQKEQSWATQAGIANGLAGPVAGIATAMDIQAKNAQIREENKEHVQLLSKTVLGIDERIRSCQKELGVLEEELADAKFKMVADTPGEKLIKALSFQVTNVTISETGAFTVKATITKTKDIKVFKDLKSETVIDGTISADLYQEGKKRGSALLVLPVFGLGPAVTVEGMGLNGAKKDVAYEIKFTPYHLWAMER